ncbi:hypothetical protein MB02_12710 [Croceicoccus estronivorus]|uniref:hypothetical protein n=1 Tax=Croceicoccus estronivorus TaxID=1172626 RepID=UPI00083389C5|nr:hypothetical protein [Croceicoccus estronivorus]OCC23217.1 hypothetical protein MB02_12710 [Croceicoccus estronivorus]
MIRLPALPLTLTAAALAASMIASPLAAKDSLGVFDGWGAFHDASVPRCYAIAMARPSTLRRDYEPYASVGTWPKRQIRNQLHFRLSRQLSPTSSITLNVSGKRFKLTGGGGDAWAQDQRMDAAIVAAMRSAGSMTISARDTRGQVFSNTYGLTGVATAMDAATVGCAKLR